MNQKIRLTIEQVEQFAIRRSNRLIAHCPQCSTDMEMLSLDEAVITGGLNARQLIAQVESGAIHSSETPQGFLLLCAASLRRETSGQS